MKTIFAYDPWRLVENELHKDDMRLSESMTSIGNGHMGMRGNFEERYSGDSHRGPAFHIFCTASHISRITGIPLHLFSRMFRSESSPG